MDVAALSVSMSQQNLAQQVQVALLSKTMDVMDNNTQALVKMMEMSVNPNLGGNVDIKV